MTGTDRLQTPQEVATFLGVDVQTLYRWRHEHRGPRAIKVGKYLRYRTADVEAYLDKQASTPAG
jgi:excisionase family DNA binding protein